MKKLTSILFIGLFSISFCLSQDRGFGVNQPQFGNEDSSNLNTQKDVTKEDVKIDPFFSTYRGVEGAGLTYDSIEWSFMNIQNYHPMFNPHINLQTLGDAGMPSIPRLINKKQESGFQSGLQLYEGYYFTHQNAPYLRAFTPFTKLNYYQTRKEYVHLDGLFSINATPGWNTTVRFQTINNAGFYPRQRSSLRQVGISSRYMDLSNRYYAQVSVNFNRMSFEENGGWADETVFDELTGVNKSADVLLNNTGNLFSHREHAVEQVYWFAGKYKKTSDTTRYYIPYLGIKHQSIFTKTYNRFTSTGTDLLQFPNIFQDSFATNDSFAFSKQTHRLGLTRYITDTTIYNVYAGLGAEILTVNYKNFEKVNPGNNLFLDAEFFLKIPEQHIRIEGAAKIFTAGYNSGDIALNGMLSYRPQARDSSKLFKKNSIFYVKLDIQNRTPAYIYQNFKSNHLQWNNNFSKENHIVLEGGYTSTDKGGERSIKIVNHTLVNPVYINFDRNPNQYSGALNLTEFWLVKGFKVGKFYLLNRIIFQLPGSENINQVLPTPSFSTYNNFFYQNILFKGALKLQLGADISWFSEYYANAYDPVSRMFYLQNRRKQGNYPFINFFAAAEIKTFRGFVKFEHANYEWFGNTFENYYYSTPAYSLSPSRVVIGINWKMYQ